MLENQRHLFDLSEEDTYLNCATMSPQLRSVTRIGIKELQKKSNPHGLKASHFFDARLQLKKHFAELIDCPDHKDVAIIPAVSYGIATVVKNIPFKKGDEIVLLQDQFPSNYYAWKALEKQYGVHVKAIPTPALGPGRGAAWNSRILETINAKTRVVSIPHVHWTDGTKFDLEAIRKQTSEIGAYLIVDGTQSIGALPFSVQEVKPDALICAGYKWLMGGYGLGMAYFGERFHTGVPIENNWINHEGSSDFAGLVNYNDQFRPKAMRYDMGESSNFILVAMLSEGIRQLNEWSPAAIQEYCRGASANAIHSIQNKGYFIENMNFRGHHLFGIYLNDQQQMAEIKASIAAKNITVSYRSNAIRVSVNVYNSEKELEKLASCFI